MSLSWAEKRRKLLQPDEVHKLLRAAEQVSMRDYTLLALVANLGLRVGEAVQLQFEDFDPERQIVRVRTSKQKGEQIDELFAHAEVFLLVAKFALSENCSEGFLFVGTGGNCLSTRQAQNIYDLACTRAGIHVKTDQKGKRGRGIHSLRHFRATLLASAGADRATVAAQLRHRSLTSTDVYYDTFKEQEWVTKVGMVK